MNAIETMLAGGFSGAYFELGPHVLLKADEKEADILYIQASNEAQDSQGDTVLQKALAAQQEHFLRKGVISYDHLHKINQDPNYIIGEPLAVAFDGDKTLVKARMYLENKLAQGVMAMAKSRSSRLGASIGGWIKKRVKTVDEMTKAAKNVVTDVIWDETAITVKPINDATLGAVSTVPFAEFAKSWTFELNKALEAGTGTDAATMTGGRALVMQSLMGAKKQDAKKRIVDVMNHIKAGKVKNHKDLDALLAKNNLGAIRAKFMRHVIDNNSK